MDSLYGDLPPPVSSNKKTGGNNEKKNLINEEKNNYIGFNKFLITPAIVQKNIANTKKEKKELEKKNSGNEDEENEGQSDDEEDIFWNHLKDGNVKNKVEKNNLNIKKKEKINETTTNIEIINMNKSIQDDLKKISDRLNKIQHNYKNEQVPINSNKNIKELFVNNNFETDIKHTKSNHYQIDNLLNHENMENDTFQYDLYEKYFIANANEDYEPNKPNDLIKIIKERKRKKIIMLAEQKKKLEMEEMDDSPEKDTNNVNCYERKNSNINSLKNMELDYEKKRKLNEFDDLKGYDEERKKKETDIRKSIDNNMSNHPSDDDYTYNYGNINHNENSYNSNDDNKDTTTSKKDFATRMMEKMGWKKGEGLGKDKQGIKAPLILKKVDKRSGVIVQAPVILKNNDLNNKGENLSVPNDCTRIVHLTNLVTPEEVDETLKEEIEEEASKFGNLLNINIVVDKNLLDALAVKIYCEYESKDQAQNALNTFKGRTFAGRKVQASFATEEEYETLENND
ncbi:RNA binding protein [Plasmodium falciparum IGH-CR14]|uniref:RNA-binding protein, putative n=11 Tax=Plasmodium falciparum TaxID=5833 RepID=Q8IKT8_PLAF7|nr:RNA-binding protein, putative [Plasmodium falciparum 3D7]ETW15926.1 hypothetical protein PFFVO_05167 [Plasmodium falciparum Vietnam Oak-Knoll (FVO)]ETW28143.1 hypothetical protein PFFCH_04494 [Plasmodium falciparum FCH/4]ETW33756.1 hypothetical protein PFTANZ_05518 [Plasmodium falciparum Tanzania (2000708)]ETW39716.1 hypothetical protein PFNF135_05745 [Plasmodium falciparum NF135/5.C10]ETW46470.1 hypothetical protein PFMALIP_05374 [Plasmodium falciparum MaliPS096_E11]EUR62391.1 hypothetica|eukprot:XP_001348687.1 RNA-binding protein, putative [Plasmodium falciparum 3D7]